MIMDLDLSAFDLIRKLNHSRFIFYLSGSRYFGYANPKSDWDFYTKDSVAVESYLKSSGFVRKSMHPSWYDVNTVAVYEHECDVEVALVKNTIRKSDALLFVKKRPHLLESLRSYSTPDRHIFWDEIYELIKEPR